MRGSGSRWDHATGVPLCSMWAMASIRGFVTYTIRGRSGFAPMHPYHYVAQRAMDPSSRHGRWSAESPGLLRRRPAGLCSPWPYMPQRVWFSGTPAGSAPSLQEGIGNEHAQPLPPLGPDRRCQHSPCRWGSLTHSRFIRVVGKEAAEKAYNGRLGLGKSSGYLPDQMAPVRPPRGLCGT